jgi:hypothetical protein
LFSINFLYYYINFILKNTWKKRGQLYNGKYWTAKHFHESINTKFSDMDEKFNAPIILLIHYSNGSHQHTKFVFTSGGEIKYVKSEDDNLTNQLWHRYWNTKKVFDKCIEMSKYFQLKKVFRENTWVVCIKWRMAREKKHKEENRF